MDQRDPKKTDTLQIRLAPDLKKDFLDACEEDGVPASEVMRRSILDYLTLRKRPSHKLKGQSLMMFFKPARRRAGLFAGLAGVVALATFAVLPSTAQPNFRTAFEKLDANGDGRLDASEFTPLPFPGSALIREARVNDTPGLPRDVMTVEADVRQDAVTPRAPAPAEQPSIDFRRFDANGDGAVTYDEFAASLISLMQPMFDGRDSNHDGKLTRAELDAPVTVTGQIVETKSLNRGPLPPGVEGPQPITGRMPLPFSDNAKTFAALDRNHDGVVTFEEFVPPA